MPFTCIWYSLIFVFIRLASAIAASPAISNVEGLINALPAGKTELINIFNNTNLSQIAESLDTTNLSHLASPPNITNLNLTNDTPTCYPPTPPYLPTSDAAISDCIAAANYMSSLPDASVPRIWSAAAPYGSRWNMASCEIYLDAPYIQAMDTFALAEVAWEAIRIAMYCATRADFRKTTGGVNTVGPGNRWEVKVKPRQIPRAAK